MKDYLVTFIDRYGVTIFQTTIDAPNFYMAVHGGCQIFYSEQTKQFLDMDKVVEIRTQHIESQSL